MRNYFPTDARYQAGALLLLAALMGLVANGVHPQRVVISTHRPVAMAAEDSVFIKQWRKMRTAEGNGPTATEAASSAVTFINTRQLLALRQNHLAVVVDARSEEEFNSGHIPEAIHLPYERFFEYPSVVASLPRDLWIVTYCDGPPCDLSHRLAYELLNAGFKLVAIYDEGLNGWKKTNPVVTAKGGKR